MDDKEKNSRCALQLLQIATNWVQRTGWPDRDRDEQVAEMVYRQWLDKTQATWSQSNFRDVDELGPLLADAMGSYVEGEACLSVLVLLHLNLQNRLRRDGYLDQGSLH